MPRWREDSIPLLNALVSRRPFWKLRDVFSVPFVSSLSAAGNFAGRLMIQKTRPRRLRIITLAARVSSRLPTT